MTLRRALDSACTCRICRGPLADVLAFGDMPLANELVATPAAAAAQERFPLTLAFCARCSLVQLRETVDPHRLFRDYVYLSSNSRSFVAHAQALVERLIGERRLDGGSRVVEIASNDGYLLQHYARSGIPVLGIEPALNVAAIARQRGVETRAEFFTSDLAGALAGEGLAADVVHANNVLAHVAGLTDMAAGIGRLLKANGVAVIEVPYLLDLLQRLEFDTIYHEHLCYFALTPLVRLFDDAGLQIFDGETLAVHGGSLRLFVGHAGARPVSESVARLLAREAAAGVGDPATYRRFGERVGAYRGQLAAYLRGLRGGGRTVAAYGASAKGTTLLNYCAVGADLIDFVADLSPLKQGRCMPGVGIPIVGPEQLAHRRPDFVVLLAWNFADEIARQQAAYLGQGGRFVVPVPEPHLLSDGG